LKDQSNIIHIIDQKKPDLFSAIDKQFASFLGRLSNDTDPVFILSARLVSNWTGRGNVCLHIPSIAGKNLYNIPGDSSDNEEIILFNEKEWIASLKNNPCVGIPGEFKPLILDEQDRLYLHKYWYYEQMLADNIRKRLSYDYAEIDKQILNNSISRLFPDKENDSEQVTASTAALLRNFCVISGGPGTGKTSTILKILVMLLEQSKKPLRIVLTAPTGKAAAKINQSIVNAIKLLNCDAKIKENLPAESFTIHRLLNSARRRSLLQEEHYEQLPYDVVVVDESSMADLSLMYRLFEAVPPDSRIILLGDKDQLSSVEAGAVFGEICDTGKVHKYSDEFKRQLNNSFNINDQNIENNKNEKRTEHRKLCIGDSIIILKKSYRFDHDSGIKRLSEAIKNGYTDEAMQILKGNIYPDISLTDPGSVSVEKFLTDKVVTGYKNYINEKKPEEKFRKLSGFTILCAVRVGRYGLDWINMTAEAILSKYGLISIKNEWYENRPVMITQNDYNLKLFNGDTGLILKDQEDNARFFSESGGILKRYLPQKLPAHETVFAMTVHKSQGSEFDNVLLVLPDFISPVLCRELLYTAITRARKRVEIFGDEKVIRHMIVTPTQRTSGLRDALWEAV
jgi:exodeoxyribonuclease V alpha subunit